MLFTGAALLLTFDVTGQSLCDPNGNVIIYSNYDGGYLNISVDANIANLKVGITTYEDCEITFSGPYAGNITQVIYAGYQGNNLHCNPSPPTIKVNGVSSSLVTILQYPAATWSNVFGYPFIICNYSCDSASYQGGCNTPDQIVHYFLTQFSGTLRFHYTQYGCWQGTYKISDGGNCCIGANIIQPQYSLVANFSASDDSVCIKELVTFTNLTVNTYPGSPTYLWDFGDGTFSTQQNTSHAWYIPGTYVVTLTATESSGTFSSSFSKPIDVVNCVPTGIPDLRGSYSLYPLPAKERILICPVPAAADLTLRTISGSFIPIPKPIAVGDCLLLNTAALPAGTYLLQMTGSHGSSFHRIIIE